MPKPTHREVKFSKEEMEYEIPDDLDLSKLRYIGRGRGAIEMARRISQAHGAEKRRLIESLPCREEPRGAGASGKIQLEPDLAAIFKDSQSVNKALRAIINAIPANGTRNRRKTA